MALVEADARVEPRHREVGQEVGEHDQEREQHHRALDDRVVVGVDRLHGERGDAGPREDRLRDDGAPEQAPELHAEDRHDREGRVPAGMLEEQDAIGDALGARRAETGRAPAEPGGMARRTPRGIAIRSPTAMPANVSSSVAGIRSRISARADSWVKRESPKAPRTAARRDHAYRTQ